MTTARTQTGVRHDPYAGRYAARMSGMTTSEIRALFAVANRPEVVSLAGGSPYTAALPLDAVGAMLEGLIADRGPVALNYGPGQGDPVLREQICEVMALEGIDASPEDVVVTVGSQQGLDLVSRVFLDPGDVVLAEAPSYVGALGTFAAAQADVVHVAMDDHGLVPEALRAALADVAATGRRAKFLYTVPNFHNPAGVSLAESRRDEVLAIAASHDLLVLEDNPYGLLGFEGDPTRALRARTDDGVIYLGSFSKTFAPGFRVGWVLAPHAAREKIVLASGGAGAVPAGLQPDGRQPLPRHAAVAGADQGVPRAVPGAPRRAAGSDGRAPAGELQLDALRRRFLQLGDPAARAALEDDAAAGARRARRVRAGDGLLRRRVGRGVPAAVVLLPAARPHPRGRPAVGRRHRGRAGAPGDLRPRARPPPTGPVRRHPPPDLV